MKIINTVAALALTLLMTSCGKEDRKVVADNAPAIPVTVAQVTANGSNAFLSASGKVQATNSADLSTRMMGFVNKVHVNVGDKVSKGQLLITINNTDLQAKKAQVNASVTEATAAFNNAEKDYNRFKSLFANNSASQKEMDDMTAHFEMAKARLSAAKEMENEVNAQFAYSNLRAPFDGVVTLKTVKEGDMANPGQPLISVESPGTFEVVAMVPETEISKIKNGTVVDVLVKSIDGTLKGKVTEVSASAKHTGGQYLVKIVLDATEANILSGMFATVQFPVEKQTKAQIVLVPLDAIVANGQLTGIYTVSQSNTAILRWVRLGRTFGNQVEVLSGLNADEGYIVSAEGRLFNGAKVSVQ